MRHETFEQGLAAISDLRRRRGALGGLDVYSCRFCKGYHVGHSKGRQHTYRRR